MFGLQLQTEHLVKTFRTGQGLQHEGIGGVRRKPKRRRLLRLCQRVTFVARFTQGKYSVHSWRKGDGNSLIAEVLDLKVFERVLRGLIEKCLNLWEGCTWWLSLLLGGLGKTLCAKFTIKRLAFS